MWDDFWGDLFSSSDWTNMFGDLSNVDNFDLMGDLGSLGGGGGGLDLSPILEQIDPSQYDNLQVVFDQNPDLAEWFRDNWDPETMGDPSRYGLNDLSSLGNIKPPPLGGKPTGGSKPGSKPPAGLGALLGPLASLFGGGGGGGLGGLFGNNMSLPGILSGLSGLFDSGQYMDIAREGADRADPFAGQRKGYQDLLHQLTTDPESYLKNDPGYQSTLKLALGPAQSKLRSKGYGNSGNMLSELTQLSGDVTNKYLGQMMDRFGHFGGADFGPDAAARLWSSGMTNSVNARNGALASLMYGLNSGGGGGGNNNGGGGGPGGFNWTEFLNSIGNGSGMQAPYTNETDPTGYHTPYNTNNPYDINGL